MRKLIVTFLVLSTLGLNAQRSANKGDQQFGKLAFNEALNSYLDADKTDGEIMLKIADSYRMLLQHENALQWYTKAYDYHKNNTVALVNYANELVVSGDYQKARGVYEEALAVSNTSAAAINGIKSCDLAEVLNQQPELFEVITVDFNSENYDFSPTFYEDGIVFASDRTAKGTRFERSEWTGNPFIDLYYTIDGEENQSVSLMKKGLNTVYNDGPVCYNSEETEMFFTRNYLNGTANQILNLQVLKSSWNKRKSKWGKAEELPFNNATYSVAHPSLSKDNKYLYFTSDMPGGLGGTDIWKVKRTKGTWGTPENLGADVNTAGDEKFPFIGENGSLYFASNGHPGLGGLDIFRVIMDEETQTAHLWNLGAPLNSSSDDFGLVLDRSGNGYFTSSRVGGKGYDDIYKAKTIGNYVELTVVDKDTKEVLPGAKVEFLNGQDVAIRFSDEDGHIHYPIASGSEYQLTGSKEGYLNNQIGVNTDGFDPGETIKTTLELQGDYNLYAGGVVLEKQSGLPLENATVILENEMTGADTLVTNADGLFYFPIAPNWNYQLKAEKEGYAPANADVASGNNSNDTLMFTLTLGEGERVYNVAFDNIYFDYDKSTLRDGSIVELDKMIQILTLSEKLRVEISAHTDSRASQSYNLRLSDRRAKTVVDYLIEKGIEKSRLLPKGYGESRLRNNCTDAVECSEEEHQQNRRVEFAAIDENNKVILKVQN